MIHKTSIVDSKAKIARQRKNWPLLRNWTKWWKFKSNTIIHSHVSITGKTMIGKRITKYTLFHLLVIILRI